jgi:hypothetical protein
MTWQRVTLLPRYTLSALSEAHGSDIALSQSCPIGDERSDCEKTLRRDDLLQLEAELIESEIRLPF